MASEDSFDANIVTIQIINKYKGMLEKSVSKFQKIKNLITKIHLFKKNKKVYYLMK